MPLVHVIPALADEAVLVSVPDVAGVYLDVTLDAAVAVQDVSVVAGCADSVRPDVHAVAAHVHAVGSGLDEPRGAGGAGVLCLVAVDCPQALAVAEDCPEAAHGAESIISGVGHEAWGAILEAVSVVVK